VIEKDVVLSVARHLRGILVGRARYDVHMTRATDVFVSLDRRVAISREKGASLFISIHADTVATQDIAQAVRGATVYTLSEQAIQQAGPDAGRQGEQPSTSWPASTRPCRRKAARLTASCST
jgi:N-acetylmuramoyl-L-alanine amidase